MAKIRVKSSTPKRRRAGMAFTREGRDLDTAKLKKEQLEAIQSDPLLSVTEIADEGEKGGKK